MNLGKLTDFAIGIVLLAAALVFLKLQNKTYCFI